MNIQNLLKLDPFNVNKKRKELLFKKQINLLTNHHYKNCANYRKILKNLNFLKVQEINLENLPPLPASIFKKFDLKSVPNNKIFKKLTSSGTSNQQPSKIYLDKENALNQTKVLTKIVSKLIGSKRLPMLIIDKNPNNFNRETFSARIAAIYGFSIFGKNHCYLLKEDNQIDYKSLINFLNLYSKEKFLIFGFTSLVFENLIKKISKKQLKINFSNGILLHGGGWKKLENMKISNDIFKKKLFDKLKLKNIYNYYGLIEQTGSIFIECKCGYFVTSIFSEIFIRDKNFNIVKNGKRGIIQLFSLLPTSYPGHNILTEDIGEIIDGNSHKCNLKGKHFLVHGRAKEAEIRGCSDAR